MPDQIKIAELNIDTKELLKNLSETKTSINELTKSQNELKKSGGDTSEVFLKNEVALKNLRQEYGQQIKVLQSTTGATEKLNKALDQENKGVDEAKVNNAELRKIRNQLNESTVEGAKAIELINEKLNKNDELINKNSSDTEKLKQNIGNYKEDIKGAAEELDVLNGGLGGFIQKSQEAGGAGKAAGSALTGMKNGIVGMTKAALAFIATPIGLVVTALVAGFLLVKNAMDRSENTTNKLRKAFSAFTGIINSVLKVLEPLGNFLIDGIVKGMELAEKAIYKAMDGIAKGLEFLGFDEKAKDLRAFNAEIVNSATQSKALKDAQVDLEKSQRKARITTLEYSRANEKLRQIRDDETKSMKERMAANEQLGVNMKNQSRDELAIADKAVKVAQLRIKVEGETTEALDAQAEALTNVADINERLTGQESEQLSNRNALRKESAEKATEIADEAIAKQQEQLDLFIAEQGIRAKTLAESLETERQISAKSIAILDAELKNKTISQEKYDTEVLNIKNALLQKQAELAVENAQIELQDYIKSNESKLEANKFLTQQLVDEEVNRLNQIAEKQKEFAALQLAEGVINQTQYNDAINAVNAENQASVDAVNAERKEAQKQADAIDFENQLVVNNDRYAIMLEARLAAMNADKQAELANAETTGADKTLIEEKYAQFAKDIQQDVTNNKLELAAGALNGLAEILGKESEAGKAVAVAQATISTLQGAISAFTSLSSIPIVGPALGAVAAGAALASGYKNVKKIMATPEPKATKITPKKFSWGGILRGKSHAQGGIPTEYGELEGNEIVLTKGVTANPMLRSMASQLNVAGGGASFADGGILGTENNGGGVINYDLLASKVAEANASLPAPVVGVDEISRVGRRVAVTEMSASF